MRNLLYKELNLSIHKFFFILPIILGLLFFIPQWFYTLVYMYLFWITVPQVYGAYLSNQDYNFISALPVTKKDVVFSKALSLVTLELLQLAVVVVFVLIHNAIYGSWNFGLDTNMAYIGVGFLMYGLFNVSFLPYYFKTGYFFGKPLILGSAVTLVYAGLIEYGVMASTFVQNILEGSLDAQILVLIGGIVLGLNLTVIAIKVSMKRYEQIDR